jgi:hypothetical protein
MQYLNDTELSSHEGTRCQFNGGKWAIKSAEGRIRRYVGLGIDVHQDFYVVVMQEDGGNQSRRSDLGSKRSCILRPSLSKVEPKCTPSMKRAGLVFLCSGN